jgi:hypothetical protein
LGQAEQQAVERTRLLQRACPGGDASVEGPLRRRWRGCSKV